MEQIWQFLKRVWKWLLSLRRQVYACKETF